MEQEIGSPQPTPGLINKLITSIIVTALVSGGAVFLWQNNINKGKEQTISQQQNQTQTPPSNSTATENNNIEVNSPGFQSSVNNGVYRNETAGFQMTFPVGEIDVTETRFLSIMEPNTWNYTTIFRNPKKYSISFYSDSLSDGGYHLPDKVIERENIKVNNLDLEKTTIKNQNGSVEQIIVFGYPKTKGFNHWLQADFSAAPTAQELEKINSIIKSFKAL